MKIAIAFSKIYNHEYSYLVLGNKLGNIHILKIDYNRKIEYLKTIKAHSSTITSLVFHHGILNF